VWPGKGLVSRYCRCLQVDDWLKDSDDATLLQHPLDDRSPVGGHSGFVGRLEGGDLQAVRPGGLGLDEGGLGALHERLESLVAVPSDHPG